jgi:predicted nucleic acid-binding protein
LSIQLEATAKVHIQHKILQGSIELVWSYMMDYENHYNPYENRRNAIANWRHFAKVDIDASDKIVERGKNLMNFGLKKKDALHIACAIEAQCDYFLTTDKKILKSNIAETTIINPLDFIKILEI